MQKVANSEVSLDFSNIKLDELEAYRNDLRDDIDNLKKEIKIMQDRNAELEQQVSQKDETIREQGQVLIAKNSTIDTEQATKDTEVPQDISMEKKTDAYTNGIPVFYTMTLVQDKKVLQRSDIDYMQRKPSVFESLMSKFAFKKKSHMGLVQLVINKELSPEQVNAIRGGLESGLDEEQLELIINKNLSPEKIESIIRFAALQNSLKAERGGM